MPCEDCQGIKRELSRVRILLEQSFLGVMKRLDGQDKYLLSMMELLSKESPVVDKEPLAVSTNISHGPPARRSNGICEKEPHVTRPAILPNARPQRRRRRVSNFEQPSFGRSDGQFVNPWFDQPTHAVDYGAGFMDGSVDSMSSDHFYKNNGQQQGNSDFTATMDSGVLTRDVRASNEADYQTNEDPGYLLNDPPYLPSHRNEDGGPDFLDDVDDPQEDVTAPEYSMGDYGGHLRMESGFINEQENGAAYNSSGTACVTVRSAIRMEDLNRPDPSARRGKKKYSKGNQGTKLKKGQRFETMRDFIHCLSQYQESLGIALMVADSKKVETMNKRLKPGVRPWNANFKYVYIELRCCRSGPRARCPFRLVLLNSKSEGRLMISKLVESHHEGCSRGDLSEARMRLLKRLL